jgi:hypothetical protein
VASAPPIIQTTRITRLTSMPEEAARSRLSATARMALPILVRWSISATATRTMIEMTIEASERLVMVKMP